MMTESGLKVRDIAFIGVMVAVIEVCKFTMMFLPNIELTSFWLIMLTIYFEKKCIYVVPVFILLEGLLFGMGLWWVMYLYAWPLLIFITYLFKKNQSVIFWSILSGLFGLSFGAFCSLPYFVIGFVDAGFRGGLMSGFTWWVAGIPFDIAHGIGNFILMFLLYKPISKIILKIKQEWEL